MGSRVPPRRTISPPPQPTPLRQVGRKPFNIKQSETLQYAFMTLQDAPGLSDPR